MAKSALATLAIITLVGQTVWSASPRNRGAREADPTWRVSTEGENHRGGPSLDASASEWTATSMGLVTTPITVTPASITLTAGDTQQFSQSGYSGTNLAWTATGGTITTGNSGGLYTAPVTPGTYTVEASATGLLTNYDGTATVTVLPAPATPVISGPLTVTAGATRLVASVPAQAGMSYTWTASNGAVITAGQGSSAISYSAGTSSPITLSCTVANAIGASAIGNYSVAVAPAPALPVITALSQVALNETGLTGSVAPQAGMSYLWSVDNGATITSGQGTPDISYSAGSGSPITLTCTVTNAAGTTASASQSVTVFGAPPVPVISAPSTVTAGATELTASVPAQSGVTYAWTVNNGALITGGQGTRTIAFTAGTISPLTVTCTVANVAGTATGSLDIAVSPQPATPVITTMSPVRAGTVGLTASVQPQPGMTYVWSADNGAVISGGQGTSSITYAAGTSTPITLTCTVANAAGSSASSQLAVDVSPSNVNAWITADPTVLPYSTGNKAWVTSLSGYSYQWTVSGGQLTSSSSASSITYTAGPTGDLTLHCVVTSPLGPSGAGTRTVVITNPYAMSVNPTSASLLTGQSQQFSSYIYNPANPTVLWSVSGGSVTQTGLYTAPSTPGTFAVTVTSQADAKAHASALVHVAMADVSGAFTTNANEAVQLYQNGVDVAGTWAGGDLKAKLDGLVLTGTIRGTIPFALTFSADGASFSGVVTYFNGNATRTGTRGAKPILTLTPLSQQMQPGGLQTFVAQVGGAVNKAISWSASGGQVDPAGHYTAPPQVGVYSITATSAADPTVSATATVQVTANGVLDISGDYTTNTNEDLKLFQSGNLVTGTWNGGEVKASLQGQVLNGTLRGTNPFSLTFAADGKSFSGVVTLYGNNYVRTGTRNPGVILMMTPASAVLPPGGAVQFAAPVGGTLTHGVTWSASAGTITADGMYIAPSAFGVYTVTATSQADSTQSASATVVVNQNGLLDVSGAFTLNVAEDFQLYQNGSTVTGTWNGGEVVATLEGLVLTGTVRGTNPFSLTFSADGNSFTGTINLVGNNNVRTGTRKAGVILVAIQPASAAMTLGGVLPFTASVGGSMNKGVVWSASGGSIGADGTFTAPTTPGVYTVTATSSAAPTASVSATVVVNAAGILNVAGDFLTNLPDHLYLFQNGTQITGTWNGQDVTGSLQGLTVVGTVRGTNPFSFTFSPDGNTFSGVLTWEGVNLNRTGTRQTGVVVSLSPVASVLAPGASEMFQTAVAGASDSRVVLVASGGTIASDGTYTAPSTPGNYTITATSVADSTKSATANVQVSSTGVLDVSGTYTTNYGTLTLFQNGSEITGTWADTYYSSPAVLRGFLNGTTVQGIWAPGGFWSRNFSLTFAADGQSFTGYFLNYYSSGVTWTGTRQAGVSIRIEPLAAVVQVGAQKKLSIQVAGAADKTFSLTTTGGTIAPDGTFTAPSAGGTCIVTATSTADPTKTVQATVLVTATAYRDVSGTYATNYGDMTLYQSGSVIQGTWNDTYYSRPALLTGVLNGRILTGTYTVDAWTRAFSMTLRDDGSGFDGTFSNYYSSGVAWNGTLKTGTLSIRMLPGVGTLPVNGGQQFAVQIAGVPDKAYQLSATAGQVDAGGNYLAPPQAGTFLLTATSHADATKTAVSTIQVTADGTMDVSGTYTSNYGTLTLYQDGASVTGDWTDSYYSRPARITAVLSGRTLTGTYSVDTWVQPFSVVMQPDASGYSGSFNNYYGSAVAWTATLQKGLVSIRMTPGVAVIPAGSLQTFKVVTAGSPDKGYTLTATGGSVAPDGTYAAPATPGMYSVTATSHADATKSAVSTIQVTADGTMDVSGTYTSNYGTLTLYQDGASVTGDWTDSYYSRPARITATLSGRTLAGTYALDTWVQPFSVVMLPDASGFAGSFNNYYGSGVSWTATLQKGITSIQVTPLNAVVRTQDTQAFDVHVAGNPDKAFSLAASSGTVDNSGLYTAPTLPGVYSLSATSHGDPSKTASAQIQVTGDGLRDVSGTYTTNYGTLTLYQAGPTITGTWSDTYYSVTATLTGTLSGRILNGTYTVPGWSRTFSMTFRDDGSGFDGYFLNYYSSGVTWTSTFQKNQVTVLVNPASSVLTPGWTEGLLTQVAGTPDKRVSWSVQESNGGSVNTTGAYTAPVATGTFHVVAASVAAPACTATASVKVAVVGLQVLPAWARVRPGTISYYQATVQGAPLDGIAWSVQEGAAGGTIGADGKYTAPNQPGTYHLIATSTVDPSASAVAEVVVTDDSVVQVEIAPYTVQLEQGAAQQFTASVANATNTSVTWKASAGTIDQTGLYIAPNAYGNYTVTATSAQDASASDTANVIVSSGTGSDKVFTYDLNGNLTSDGTRQFEWDAENRLVAVVKGTHRSEFGYDGFGHRVEIRELDADANGNWVPSTDTKYVWEGAEILESRTADGGTTLQRYFDEGFMDADGTALYYTKDHLGSIRELVDAFGAIRARYDYDPFGRTTKLSGDKDSPFQYAGYLWQATSGLYFAVNREYDPTFGRWISRDPGEETGGKNLYAYVGNNPINFTDPLGLCKQGFWKRFGKWFIAAGIAIGLTALTIFAPELGIPLWIMYAADLGAAINVAMTVAVDLATGQDITPEQVVAAETNGAVTGAVSAMSGPLAGSVSMSLAGTSSTVATPVLSAAISGFGSAAGQYLSNAIDSAHQGSVVAAGIWGAWASYVFQAPTQNMNTFSQASYFGPTNANLPVTLGAWAAGDTLGNVPSAAESK